MPENNIKTNTQIQQCHKIQGTICASHLHLCMLAANNWNLKFKMVSLETKYLGMKLTEDLQYLYNENYKKMLKQN